MLIKLTTMARPVDLIVLECDLVCPLSGMKVDGGKRVVAHRMVARMCRTGKSIFIVCNPHQIKGFISDPIIVAMIVLRNKHGKNAAAGTGTGRRYVVSAR